MKSDVRILLLGDRGTGKSTILQALLKERFESEVPPRLSDITIPAHASPDRVTTHVTDTSLRVQDESEIADEICTADVACVVYALDDEASLARVKTYWLPLIRKQGVSRPGSQLVPVILVGNKTDKNAPGSPDLKREILDSFPEIETSVECSAKSLHNVPEIFFFAQKAVLYPTHPLYEKSQHRLKDAAATALSRVFRICDEDKDGLLSDDELSSFQQRCFDQPLSADQLRAVKDVVKGSTKDGVDQDCITESGFLFLHKLFIERSRQETIWKVLRMYGYGDDLSLKADFLHPPLRVDKGCAAEISEDGESFLIRLFRQYDSDGAGFLTNEQLEDMFSITPGNPFHNGTDATEMLSREEPQIADEQLDDAYKFTLERFLALWTIMCHDDPETFMEYMAYLGFSLNTAEDTAAAAVRVTKSRVHDRLTKSSSRKVNVSFVFGAVKSGKSFLLQQLAKHGCFTLGGVNGLQRIAAGRFQQEDGSIQTVIMKEFAVQGDDAEVVSSTSCGEECDVAVFCYDASDSSSFEYAMQLHQQMVGGPRTLFVATKTDKEVVEQECAEQPEAYCKRYSLPPPFMTTASKSNSYIELFETIIARSQSPQMESAVAAAVSQSGGLVTPLTIVLTAAAVAGLAYAVYRMRHK